jgi:hypothetical protein
MENKDETTFEEGGGVDGGLGWDLREPLNVVSTSEG